MPATTCIRCFAVFGCDDARPGVAPVCPVCATALTAIMAPPPPAARTPATPARRIPRPVLFGAAATLAVLVALAVAVAARWIVL